MLKIVREDMAKLISEGHHLRMAWKVAFKHKAIPAYINTLGDYKTRVGALAGQVTEYARKYDYFDDVVAICSTPYLDTFNTGHKRYERALRALGAEPQIGQIEFFVSPYMDELTEGINAWTIWKDETQAAIIKRRQELVA